MTEKMSTTRPAPYSRRTNKPLVEKRRRARINDCLGELKTLVLQAMKQDSAQISRLEKADILEMTVKYLHHVQRQQPSSSMVNNPQSAAKYRAGFTECASEVMRYMSNIQGVNPDVSTKLNGHLAGCLSMVNSATASQMSHPRCEIPVVSSTTSSPIKQEAYQIQMPLQIQIPDNKVKTSRDSGINMLLVPVNPPVPHSKPIAEYSPVGSPARQIPSSYSYNELKNITNTYVSPKAHAEATKLRHSYSPVQRCPTLTADYAYLAPKQFYDPISPVYSPQQSAFHDEKLWRPW